MIKHYLLDENKQPYEVSFEEGLKVYEDPEMKIVQQDLLDNGVLVSTVFLGLDHAHYTDYLENANQKPVLFETMIFKGVHDGYQKRYTSYKDALKGHFEALSFVSTPKLSDDE
jgi:hypothetical protein